MHEQYRHLKMICLLLSQQAYHGIKDFQVRFLSLTSEKQSEIIAISFVLSILLI